MNHQNTKQSWRPLTAGETAMAARLFGAAIDYTRVRIYRHLPVATISNVYPADAPQETTRAFSMLC